MHTPGPWSRNIPPATKYTTVWSGRNLHVAHVAARGLSADEVESNICLIAAAPDLLAALKRARAQILFDDRNAARTREILAPVDAAIARAEGRD